MKNGIFNIIRRIAFCFVLSIICLFGRVETKADTYTGVDLWQMFEKRSCLNWPDDNTPGSYLDGLANMYSDERCNNFMYLIAYDSTREIYHLKIDFSYGKQAEPDYVYQFCQSRNYKYLGGNYFLDNNNYLCTINADHTVNTYTTVSGRISVVKKSNDWSWTTNPYTSNSNQCDFTVMLAKPSYSPSSSYDSTLGYLTNVKVKRASPFLLTDMSTDFTNIIDRFSWGAITSGGSSLDGVDIRIKTFKNDDILGEVEKHINCPPDNYNFDWGNYIDLSLKDWVFGNLFRYEIYFRPTFGNKYGDYCYFNVGFPTSVNEQIEATLDPKYLTDTIQYVENVGYIDNFDNYSPPSDGTTLFVPNYVVPNKPIDDINKDLDDDNVVPSSSPSYTEIINNITIIQNGNEDGGSLIDKLGDLLSFFTNFLTFLYNFINLILSPLSFLPGWLKSLLSMSIIAFIVICIIKTVRG